MNRFGKIAVLAIVFTIIFGGVGAQELGIALNGGLQGMQYQLPGGQSTVQPAGSLGLTYTFRVSDQWGILTGILGSVYRTKASLNDGSFSYGQVDDAGSAFIYNVKVTGYEETQQFFAATIPLLLHFHTGGAGTQWFFDGGGKIVFPFNSSIQASASQLSLSGYYPDFHLIVSNLPQHGFGTLNGWHAGASSELKPAGALSAGTGVSLVLSGHSRLYIGVYVDYGLTDLKAKHDSAPLVTYSPAGVGNVKPGGVMNMPNSGAATLLSYGLQLRLSFGSTRKKPAGKPKEEEGPAKTEVLPPARDSVAPVTAKPELLPPKLDSAAATMDATSLSDSSSLDVVFGIVGETTIPEAQKAQLDDLAFQLKKHPDVRVSIEGHFCDGLTEQENSQTALARARAVGKYLENKGINRHRMDISYSKKSDPVVSYDPAANYWTRRVVIGIIGSF
jgi:outer membrane protein OmpA-like peptidoglycan-associated protein